MHVLNRLFEQNRDWAERIESEDPGFFSELAKQQEPDYLWIGCADSRVPATQLLGLRPGDVFVHRNIANMVVHTDFSCLSVVQYAVEVLKVKHIIVCGHYGCGGVAASIGDQNYGLIDHWLRHIRDVYNKHESELSTLHGQERTDRLCELNVLEQVRNLCGTPTVQEAWKRGQVLHVHGLIYNMKDGLLNDLGIQIQDSRGVADIYHTYKHSDSMKRKETAQSK